MPYRQSRARKQFITDITQVNRTLAQAFSNQCRSSDVREFALCSAVVLCSAKLESYLEALIADWVKALQNNQLTTDTLHLHTRAFLLSDPTLESLYRRYVLYANEAEMLPELSVLMAKPYFAFGSSGQPIPAFPASRIYADSKYPSPRNIKRLFNRCGVKKVFSELNRIARRDVEALLNSFNDVRTEMAHDGMPVGMTAADIKKGIRDAEKIVGYIDRMFYSHVNKWSGAACWVS